MLTVDDITPSDLWADKLNYETLYRGRYVKATELWFVSDLLRQLPFAEQIFFVFSEILLNIPKDGGYLKASPTRSHASG